MPSSLCIQRVSRLANIPSDRLLRRWVKAALAALKSPIVGSEVTVRIVNAAEGRQMNSAFRGKDYATNVLTFVYHDVNSPLLMGDVVLCAPVIAAEAKAQGKTLADHYAHLAIHGILHLAGHDHEAVRDAKRMEAVEVATLAKLGIDDPYR